MTNIYEPRGARRSRSDAVARSPRGETRAFQIGPRIRVGGTLGRVGQNVKIATGKALSNPIVDGALGLIPGVGPGISAAAGAAGRALDTSDGGLHGWGGVGSLAAGAGKGYVAGMAGNAIRGGIQNIAKNGIGKAISGGMGVFGGHTGQADGSVANPDGSAADSGDQADQNTDGTGTASTSPDGESFLDRIKGLLGGAGKALGGAAGGMGGLGDMLLSGAAVASNSKDRSRMQGVQNSAIDYAKKGYDEKAPLRSRALASLSSDQPTDDLSSIFSNSGNVYDRQKRGLPPMTTAPSAASQLTSGTAMTNSLGRRVPAPVNTTPTSAVG